MRRFFPFLEWIPTDLEIVKADLVAGITVALVLIPQSMAYAQLAGIPAYFGLYAAFLPGVVAALYGSSRQLATGPVAVVSLLTAAAIIPLTGGPDTLSSEQVLSLYVPLAILLAFMVGLIQLTIGWMRLGVIVNFLPHPVIIGFTNAAAIIIGLSQLDKFLGVEKIRAESFVAEIWAVLGQVQNAHMPTLVMGVSAFVLMWALRIWLPRVPGILVAVTAAVPASWLLGFEQMGGSVVGTIPSGLPELALPVIELNHAIQLFPSAAIIALVGFLEAITIAKAISARTRGRLDPNQELIGQGLGNLVGSLSQSYPTSGSFSRSAVNLFSGAKSGLSAVVTGLLVMCTLLFLTPLLYHLPTPVLAAVIMMAVVNLINVKAMRHAWSAHRYDGIAAVITFFSTLVFAPHLERGIIVGIVLAVMLYIYRTLMPHVTILGRSREGDLVDARQHNLPFAENVMAIRYDGSLYFANVAFFEEAVLGVVSDQPKLIYLLIVADKIDLMDASGEEVMSHLHRRLSESGIELIFSGMQAPVKAVLNRTGLAAKIDEKNFFKDPESALDDVHRRLVEANIDIKFCPLRRQHVSRRIGSRLARATVHRRRRAAKRR